MKTDKEILDWMEKFDQEEQERLDWYEEVFPNAPKYQRIKLMDSLREEHSDLTDKEILELFKQGFSA
jgi:hypothetical protein